jgi:hypothetical protein
VDIRRGVEMGAGGLHITWQDLRAYQDVCGIVLDAFDVDAIMAMEDAVAEVTGERMRTS